MDAVVLAGGLGTRLRSAIGDFPKSMADINGKPFLEYLFLKITACKEIDRIVLSVGYKKEIIAEYFKNEFRGIPVIYSEEINPLGTGGAIKKALSVCNGDTALILNGDTYYDVDLSSFISYHSNNNFPATICLRKVDDVSRYGTVKTENGIVAGFYEKGEYKGSGYINAGMYLFDTQLLSKINLPEIFSIEKEFFEKHFTSISIGAFISDNYFIDIGIPDDYEKAKEDFKRL